MSLLPVEFCPVNSDQGCKLSMPHHSKDDSISHFLLPFLNVATKKGWKKVSFDTVVRPRRSVNCSVIPRYLVWAGSIPRWCLDPHGRNPRTCFLRASTGSARFSQSRVFLVSSGLQEFSQERRHVMDLSRLLLELWSERQDIEQAIIVVEGSVRPTGTGTAAAQSLTEIIRSGRAHTKTISELRSELEYVENAIFALERLHRFRNRQ